MKLSKNTIKQEFDSINSIDKFLEKIENNPSLVDNLSEGRLDVLINYYSNITRKNEEKISRLKKKLANT